MHDVVVIGAGSAGAVIAARASEHPQLEVLLLEAGPDYPALAETPHDLVNSHDNSYVDHDWNFTYTPVSGGRSVPFPRGRVVGGSSAVNTTIALRGLPEDYDHWAELGNREWAWERVLPAFCRLERDLDFGAEPYHGDAGPITIRRYRPDELTLPQEVFLEAAATLGYPWCADANDPDGWGAGPHPMNKAGRIRVSTAMGYLAPARARPNLTVRANAVVDRLVVEGGRVVAVELEGGEQVHGRLFVLSAGAISSPVVLLRSGIGPGLTIDVPGVGENLADHPAALVVCEVKPDVEIDSTGPLVQTILRYTGEGSHLRNDLQIEQLSFVGRRTGAAAFGIASVVEATFSRGTVRLSPDGGPVIDANFGGDDRDVDRLAQCFIDTLRFAEAGPMAALVERVAFPRLPVGLEEAKELVRVYCGSGYHPCGTVRMGPPDDPMAVVDEFGRARCVDRLVVADASIMPTVPRANTNLTCIMIGEMVGEWIRTAPAMYGL